ncbi:hypothetical protein [Morganella morganii IS15]|nr:hypothetical protein CSB69_3487 [Morganella morganii]EMP52716.1 hypothetical protein C790_03689 [Morganella morganii SC01]CDK67887.1 hypothetical protein [Morganella morganii IS15]
MIAAYQTCRIQTRYHVFRRFTGEKSGHYYFFLRCAAGY